jgi:multidrug resistance efflux pump
VKKGEPLAVLWKKDLDETPLATFAEITLEAPADGRIAERNLSVGEIVKPGDVLFQIEVDGSGRATELR